MADQARPLRIENREAIEQAIADPDVPKLYANSFIMGHSNADSWILFQRERTSIAWINLSYTLAKTLAQRLNAAIADFEARTEHEIPTTEKIDKSYGRSGSNVG